MTSKAMNKLSPEFRAGGGRPRRAFLELGGGLFDRRQIGCKARTLHEWGQ